MKNLLDSTFRYSVESDTRCSLPINKVSYSYQKPENMDAFVINEGQELERN